MCDDRIPPTQRLTLRTVRSKATGSPVGQRVLDSWETLRAAFVKVFPADYKRVLAELGEEEDQTYTATDEQPETVDVIGAPHQRIGEGE